MALTMIEDAEAESKSFRGGSKFYRRKKLQWDAENMRVTNFDATNKY
tara:strand:+ start:814 stop:954 length:141 start_codon:yes stop_codon:yes gene_type:complete